MRRSCELRRKALRFIRFVIRESEVAELVHRRILADTDRDDPGAVSPALGRLLDEVLARLGMGWVS